MVALLLLTHVGSAQFGMYITEKPKISLQDSLHIAVEAARAKIPDLDKFLLHSVKPRAIKNDPKGEQWQFLCQELSFKTYLRGISVWLYMRDGSASVREFQE